MPHSKDLTRQADEISQLLKLLAHPVRLKVLCFLLEKERSVNEIVEFCQVSQSGISQFLSRMRLEGLLKARRAGHFIYYRVADEKITRLIASLKDIYCK